MVAELFFKLLLPCGLSALSWFSFRREIVTCSLATTWVVLITAAPSFIGSFNGRLETPLQTYLVGSKAGNGNFRKIFLSTREKNEFPYFGYKASFRNYVS